MGKRNITPEEDAAYAELAKAAANLRAAQVRANEADRVRRNPCPTGSVVGVVAAKVAAK